MRFEEALKAMREGKKVSRKSWAKILGISPYRFIKDGKIMCYSGIEYYNFLLCDADVLADDWEVVPDAESKA